MAAQQKLNGKKPPAPAVDHDNAGNGGLPPEPEPDIEPPACARCGQLIRAGEGCRSCGADAMQAWGKPAGYEPPITKEESAQRQRYNHLPRKAFTDEQVWELRRQWRASSLTVGRWTEDWHKLPKNKQRRIGVKQLTDALMGRGRYEGA